MRIKDGYTFARYLQVRYNVRPFEKDDDVRPTLKKPDGHGLRFGSVVRATMTMRPLMAR